VDYACSAAAGGYTTTGGVLKLQAIVNNDLIAQQLA